MRERQKKNGVLKWLRGLHTWQLIVLLVPLLFLAATFLRLNNLGMVERRNAVLSADQAGNSEDTKRALLDLQNYVSAHMNTDLGKGVYLQYSYDRARDTALSQAGSSTNPEAAVYQQASIDCRSTFVGGVESFRNDYVQCVLNRVQTLAPGKDIVSSANLPQADDYRYDYISPLWSPDFAGLFVALSSLLVLVIIVRIIAYLFLRLLVRRYYKRA